MLVAVVSLWWLVALALLSPLLAVLLVRHRLATKRAALTPRGTVLVGFFHPYWHLTPPPPLR
jgi:hypothetical protein